MNEDWVKVIENYLKAASLNRGPELSAIFGTLSIIYGNAGFINKSEYYAKETLKLDGDSVAYYYRLNRLENCFG